MRDMGDEVKPVLYFKGKDKGLVLNKTNSNTICAAYGDETGDWEGMQVVLYETMVEFQGQRKPGIRCIVPPQKPQSPLDGETNDDSLFDGETRRQCVFGRIAEPLKGDFNVYE
jgi:hypothetical protein